MQEVWSKSPEYLQWRGVADVGMYEESKGPRVEGYGEHRTGGLHCIKRVTTELAYKEEGGL